MVFLYASTTIVYYLLLVLTATALAFSVTTNESSIFIISIVIVIVTIFGLVITSKFASSKYKKSLCKLNYDVHGYLDEQYKFLNKLFISKNVRNTINLNIASGYMNNEQYNDALDIFSQFAADGYQGLSLDMRFLVFMKQAECYINLNRFDMVSSYINNGEMILRTARFPANIYYELNLLLEYAVAEYNLKLNPNQQNAQELINRINAVLNNNLTKNGFKSILMRYQLGALYMLTGDTNSADSEFYNILQTGSMLPCVNRIKAYNQTGDMSVLKI
ncbi:MAG: hypothetical protein SOT80_09760 [Candidatus Pseudoruminococcus sp.]|nr:hypothetical protein [Ruminococcus sp.]MDY2783662.1 hypothetical protein [Candidatus Pseudoruminococcus sp.]